jgi:hypothetical protein
MKQVLINCINFYSMLEYFTTKNEDDTTKLPTIPSRPFNNLNEVEHKVNGILNEKYFEDLKINCIFVDKQ